MAMMEVQYYLLNVGISGIVAIVVSLITIKISDKFYGRFNKSKLQTEFTMNGSPQVKACNINAKIDLYNLIADAHICDNFYLDVIQGENGENTFQMEQLILIEELDTRQKWKYLYFSNHSNLDVSLARIEFDSGAYKNLLDWTNHMLRPEGQIGLFLNRKEEPKELVLDFNGWDLKYDVTERIGSLTLNIRKSQQKRNEGKLR